MLRRFHSVMFFVPDVEEATRWYADLLEKEPLYPVPDFPVFAIEGAEICFHRADAKVSAGGAGQVGYWHVDEFRTALERLTAKGARLYRGPLDIEGGLTICQVQDPFGNLIGLIGP